MKISFSTLGCPRWTWNEIITAAADLKYDGIEVRGIGKDISAPSIPQFSQERLPATMDRLNGLGLGITCLTSDICLHVRERESEILHEIEAYCVLAKAMHVPYIRVMGCAAVGAPTGQVDRGFVLDMAKRCAAIAENYGVTILIETNGVWADSTSLRKLLDDVASPACAALWDVNHPFHYYDETPADTWQNLSRYVKYMHMKDSVLEGNRIRYAMMGYGELPLEQILDVTMEGGYDGFYSLEWLKRWDMSLEEPGIVFAHYVSYMRSFG